MQFLYNYTAKHFSDEEKLQLKYRYPDYTNHKRYHEEFKKSSKRFINTITKGRTYHCISRKSEYKHRRLAFKSYQKKEDVKVATHIKSQQ